MWPSNDLDLQVTLTFKWPWPILWPQPNLLLIRTMKLVNYMQKISIFYHCDLELDPMTLIFKLDLDMMMTYLHTKNKVPSSRRSKVIACTDGQKDRQTQRQNKNIALPAYPDGNKGINCLLTCQYLCPTVDEPILNIFTKVTSWEAKIILLSR